MDYIPALRTALTKPLINEDSAGVEKVLNTLEAYDLTKEDMNNIIELGQFPSSSDVTTLIPSKVSCKLLVVLLEGHSSSTNTSLT